MNERSFADSTSLHDRVQSFIASHAAGAPATEIFDAIACDIARYQAARCTGIERLLAARGLAPADLTRAAEIPAVPTDAFRLRRISAHPAVADELVFRTSGTTSGARGEHPMRCTSTYRTSAIAWGRAMLFPDIDRARVAAIAPAFETTRDSSLGFMLALFGEALGGPTTWLVRGGSLDIGALASWVERAHADGVPVLLAGASFAFVRLLDALRGRVFALPAGSRAMQTGGFKGRSSEVPADALRRAIASGFGIPEARVVAEYGMTEVSSQAYDGALRQALGLSAPVSRSGVYLSPPWMRIIAVDPESLDPVEAGCVGLARIVDLANVDSAVVVLTSDQVREAGGGVELLGRAPGAQPRGCSLGMDELLGER